MIIRSMGALALLLATASLAVDYRCLQCDPPYFGPCDGTSPHPELTDANPELCVNDYRMQNGDELAGVDPTAELESAAYIWASETGVPQFSIEYPCSRGTLAEYVEEGNFSLLWYMGSNTDLPNGVRAPGVREPAFTSLEFDCAYNPPRMKYAVIVANHSEFCFRAKCTSGYADSDCSVGNSQKVIVRIIVAHEIGHILGLWHCVPNGVCEAMMEDFAIETGCADEVWKCSFWGLSDINDTPPLEILYSDQKPSVPYSLRARRDGFATTLEIQSNEFPPEAGVLRLYRQEVVHGVRRLVWEGDGASLDEGKVTVTDVEGGVRALEYVLVALIGGREVRVDATSLPLDQQNLSVE